MKVKRPFWVRVKGVVVPSPYWCSMVEHLRDCMLLRHDAWFGVMLWVILPVTLAIVAGWYIADRIP